MISNPSRLTWHSHTVAPADMKGDICSEAERWKMSKFITPQLVVMWHKTTVSVEIVLRSCSAFGKKGARATYTQDAYRQVGPVWLLIAELMGWEEHAESAAYPCTQEGKQDLRISSIQVEVKHIVQNLVNNQRMERWRGWMHLGLILNQYRDVEHPSP